MNVREALSVGALHAAKVVAGESGLDREVRWAHVIDMPDPAPWVRPGQLLLTTGYAWPRDVAGQRKQIRQLAKSGLAAMALAVPRYVEHFGAAAKEEADRCDLPLVEIPFEIPFAQITEELHRAIIADQYSVIERSEEIHRALIRSAARGTNLSDLARSLGELIHRSATFEDPDGKLLAHYEIEAEDDPIRRETLARAQSPPDMLEKLASAGLLEQVKTSAGPLRIAAMPDIGLKARVVCPIRLGDELVGLVWIIEGDAPLSELDFRAAEHAALIAALHIAHQRELSSLESRLGYASFLSLLESDADDSQTIERARLLGFNPERSHRACIALLPEPLPLNREAFLRRERIATQVRSQLAKSRIKPLVTTTLNYVAFLVPSDHDVTRLWRALGDDGIALLVGRPYAGTKGARASYREAQTLLTYRDGRSIRLYEEAVVPRVLMGDAGAREAFMEDLLGKLRGKKGEAALRAALLTFARCGFNLKKSAATLGVHQNTLRYRLARAVDLLGFDLANQETRFRLQLAVRILDFATNT